MLALISQRYFVDSYGSPCDLLEGGYVEFFERFGIQLARGQLMCIMDDDFRPTHEQLKAMANEVRMSHCACAAVYYRPLTFAAISSTCTILIKSLWRGVFDEGYEPAHVFFSRKALDLAGLPPDDVLFDDLAILRHFRRAQSTDCQETKSQYVEIR